MTDPAAEGSGEARFPEYPLAPGDPDPRYSLANERTYLAWVRTVLAAMAGAVALHSLALPEADTVRRIVVVLLVVGSAVAMLGAQRRWRRVEEAIRANRPVPASPMLAPVTLAVVIMAGVLLVALW